VADAAKRELQEETGLVVNNVQPVGEFKTPNRDPRMENTWSYAFKLHLKDRGIVHAGDDASAASWVPFEKLSKLPLAFDHSDILAMALK
jgi:8-oxo-dGTP diphosphatase